MRVRRHAALPHAATPLPALMSFQASMAQKVLSKRQLPGVPPKSVHQ